MNEALIKVDARRVAGRGKAFEGTSRRLWMRHGIMRCDAGTWGGRTEFVFPTSIVPPFVPQQK